DPALGPLGDPGHGAGTAEAGLAALGTLDARPGAARPGLGHVQGAVRAEPDAARVVEPVGDDREATGAPRAALGVPGGGGRGGPAEGGPRRQREQAGDGAGPTNEIRMRQLPLLLRIVRI